MEAWRKELYHHGIAGQKWGQRNGPPYPLKPSAHSSAEKKAASKTKDGSAAVALALYFAPEILMFSSLAVSASVSIANDIHDSRAEKARKNAPVDKKTGYHLKTKEMTEKEDARDTNPGYKSGERGTTQNCVHCSFAYEMRRRGYDVVATKAAQGTDWHGEIKKQFKNAKIKDIVDKEFDEDKYSRQMKAYSGKNTANADKTFEVLSKEPKNSRGLLRVTWNDYAGHAMNYSVNSEGKVSIIDPQSGDVFSEKKAREILSRTCKVNYCRTDNLAFDNKNIKRSVKGSKDD